MLNGKLCNHFCTSNQRGEWYEVPVTLLKTKETYNVKRVRAVKLGTWQKRILCFPAWTGLGECKCLRPHHISRTPSSGLRALSCRWGCRLSATPCLRSSAAVCCSSFWVIIVNHSSLWKTVMCRFNTKIRIHRITQTETRRFTSTTAKVRKQTRNENSDQQQFTDHGITFVNTKLRRKWPTGDGTVGVSTAMSHTENSRGTVNYKASFVTVLPIFVSTRRGALIILIFFSVIFKNNFKYNFNLLWFIYSISNI